MAVLCSDRLSGKRQEIRLSSHRIDYFFEPLGGKEGGDRFCLETTQEENLFFCLADAAGHGKEGARFWEAHRSSFDSLWGPLVERPVSLDSLKEFSIRFNTSLFESTTFLSRQVCLAIGCITPSGQLYFSNFGYGTHVLVRTNHGMWWKEPRQLFGLKLGWMHSAQWSKNPRAWVPHIVGEVNRVILLTDGFLEDDHKDPMATMAFVEQVHRLCSGLDFTQIVPYFVDRLPHQGDDATVVAMELCR